MSGKKSILVVDDEHDIALALKLIFTDEGYEVRTAFDGRDALALIAQQCPDLVLIDNMMPLMTGLEVISRLKGDAATKGVPVILMSVVRPAQTQRHAFDAFVQKPFELDHIIALVKKFSA